MINIFACSVAWLMQRLAMLYTMGNFSILFRQIAKAKKPLIWPNIARLHKQTAMQFFPV